MKYKVINEFRDLEDRGYIYNQGDIYPRKGTEVSDKRIKEIISKRDRYQRVFIEEVKEPKKETTKKKKE